MEGQSTTNIQGSRKPHQFRVRTRVYMKVGLGLFLMVVEHQSWDTNGNPVYALRFEDSHRYVNNVAESDLIPCYD